MIKDKFKIPLILKGIATAEDAQIAVDHGVEWIYVSNHGGRQLDHGRGAMHVLPEIVEAVKGRAKIMVDGGFCRGTDIVKAIAAGADLVGIGRLQCWALAAAGEAGVTRNAGAAGGRGAALPRPVGGHLVRRGRTSPACTRRPRQTRRACSARSRCSTTSPIDTDLKGRNDIALSRQPRMRFCSISGAWCSTSISPRRSPAGRDMPAASPRPSSRAMCATRPIGCTRSARSATRTISPRCARRSESAFRMPSSSKDGTRSSPARCPTLRSCCPARPGRCRSTPSPTPTGRMWTISRREYADLLGHFRELVPVVQHRPAQTGCGSLRPCRGGDRRAGKAYRVLR